MRGSTGDSSRLSFGSSVPPTTIRATNEKTKNATAATS
jgi:hypothetical protein